jgi:hypothetical protein
LATFAIEASPSATRNLTLQRVAVERDTWRTGLILFIAARKIGPQQAARLRQAAAETAMALPDDPYLPTSNRAVSCHPANQRGSVPTDSTQIDSRMAVRRSWSVSGMIQNWR